MNHRGTEFAERKIGVLLTLCSLCLCGFSSFAAKPEWPRLYNQGVTAYHSNDFTTAAQQFEQSLASPDRELQQRAQYNLGNVHYRQGEAEQAQAQQLWGKAIKEYESALALNPNDADAKFNREFVKKKLEELKQQQQEQQQKNQQDKQQDQKQDQKKDDQQQKSDQQQQQQPDKDKQQKEEQQKQEQQKQEQQKQQQDQPQKNSAEQKKPAPQQQPQPQPGQSDQHDKQEAKALLDNLREDERNWNFFPEVQMKDLKDSGPPAKDW